jgi:hypothetical protein
MTFFEKRRGWERRRRKEPKLAAKMLAQIDDLEAAYSSRVVPIDGPVVAEWTRLLGAKDKNQRDRALAATARVHGFVLSRVTPKMCVGVTSECSIPSRPIR